MQKRVQKISLIEYQILEFILFKYCVLMVYFLSAVDIALNKVNCFIYLVCFLSSRGAFKKRYIFKHSDMYPWKKARLYQYVRERPLKGKNVFVALHLGGILFLLYIQLSLVETLSTVSVNFHLLSDFRVELQRKLQNVLRVSRNYPTQYFN